MAKKYRTYNAITGKFGDEEDYSVDFTSQEPVQFKTYNAISGKFSYKPEDTVANTVDTLNTVSNNIKNNSVEQTVTIPKNNNISYYKKGNDLYKEEQIDSNVNGETDTYTYKTTKIKDKKEKDNILKDKSINIEDRTKKAKTKETNEYDTNLEKYFTANGKVYENKKVLAGTDNGKNIYVYEPVEITDKKEAERLKNAPGVYARDLKTRNKQIEEADAEERALNNLEKLYSGKTYLNELDNKDTWEYLRDGYNFGDITRTANKIAELKVAEPLTKVGMELKNDPKQTLKTMGVAFPTEVKNTFSSVGDTIIDFGNWISKKGYELGIEDEYDPKAKEHYHMRKEYKKILEKNNSKEIEEYFNKIKNEYENGTLPKSQYDYMKWDTVNNYLLNNGSKEEIRKYINQLEKEYKNGDLDATNYQNFKASFNYYLDQRRPKTGEFNFKESQNKAEKAIDKVLGFNVEDTETYKKHEAGELSEGQEYVWNQTGQVAQQVPVMAMSTVPYVGPAVGKAFFFAQAQNNYYEEAQQRGYTDSNARKYSIIMGAFETLIEEREGLNPFGGAQALKETAKEGMIDAVKGEAFEEFITPYADYGVRALFGEKYDLGAATDDALDGAFSAAVTTLILGSAGKGMNYVDAIANKMSNGEKFTSQELTNAVKQIEANNPGAVTDQINIYLNDLKSSGILEDVQQQDIQTSIQEEEKNRTTQEVEQKDIENSVNAFNLNEDLQLEENLDENIQETEQDVTQDIDNIESLIANISRTEVTRDLENYAQENNIENLSKQDVQNFIEEAIEKQNLNDENKELLRSKYNDLLQDYFKDQNKPKTPDEVKPLAEVSLDQNEAPKSTYKGNKLELKEDSKKGIRKPSEIAKDQYRVGNQLEQQYKGFEDKAKTKLPKSAEAFLYENGKSNQDERNRRVEYVEPIIQRKGEVTTTLGNTTDNTKTSIRESAKALILERENEIKEAVRKYNNRVNEKLSPEQIKQLEKQVKKLQDSAKKNNFDANNQTLISIQNMLNKAGVEGEFDSKMFSDEDTGGLHTIKENGKRKIVFNPKASADTILEELAIHEMAHDLMTFKGSFEKLNPKEVLDYVSKLKGYQEARQSLEEAYSKYYDRNSEEFKDLVDEEVIVSVLGKKLGNQQYINRLTQEKPSVARSIYNWVVDKLNSIVNKNGIKSEKLFWENVKNNFEKAFRLEDKGDLVKEDLVNDSTKMLVKSIDDRRLYTYNDGTRKLDTADLTQAGQKLAKYINEEIRKDKDLTINAIDGTPLTITRDTAYKIATRDNVMGKNGEYAPLSDELYGVKLRAGMYIDEIARTSKGDNKLTPDKKNHKFAKDGFSYRKAYFMDNDGQYYSMKLSVGKNGEVNSIYNLGKIKEAEFPQVAQRPGSKATNEAQASLKSSVSQNKDNVKYSVNTKTGKLQENGKNVTLDTSKAGTTGTLMAIHNLNEDKLKGILELGGFPYPSIAITNPSKLSHEGYGDISVLFNKDTINPESNSKNKVYSRDAYTPRFPKIEYKLNSNEISKLRKTIGDYDYRNAQPGDNYISDARSIIDNLEDDINRAGIDKVLDNIKNSDAMKYVYIKNTNPNFKVETKNEQFSNLYSNETLQRFLDNYDGKYELNDIPSNEVDNYTKTMVDAYKQQLQEEYDNPEIIQMQIKNLEDRFASKDNFLRAAYKLQKYGIEHQVLDTVATKEKINNSINQEDYNKWVDNQFKDIIEKKGLRNNKDYYTNSGTPRSFEQLHDDYTLDNVVKILDALDSTGAEGGMFTGVGEIAGNASIRFNNIEDIKANENLLTEIGNEEYGKMIEDIQDRLSNVEESIMDRGHNNSDNYFIARDNLSSAIADAARLYGENKKVDANRVNKILNEYGFNPNNAESQQIVDMFSELRQLPTQYFEAKPKRAVGLDEVQQIVIPNTLDAEFKKQLQDAGLQYTEYDPNIEGDRQRVINQFDNLKFSQKNASWDEFLNRNVRPEGKRTKLGDLSLDKEKLSSTKKQANKQAENNVKDSVKAMNLEKIKPKDRYSINESKKDEVLQYKTDSGERIDLKKKNNNIYEKVNVPTKNQIMPETKNESVKIGDKKVSNFYSNITEKSKFITEENRESLKDNENLKYYDAITNKETLRDAMDNLDSNPEQTVGDFFTKENFTADDVATGWILMKRYQDAGNYEAMSNVIEKMREQGTKSGQAIQMLGMLDRLTPEGMEYYAQKQLDNAYNKFTENKSKKEIEKYANDFTLTAEEHQFIKDQMEKVGQLEDEDAKKVEVAKIVKMLSDKLPPEKGAGIKAWMRIAMLGNAKTQVRNIMGNAIIQPVNWTGDIFGNLVDKAISKKTGVRTKGNTDFGALAGGFIKGGKDAIRDARLGIDTRDINLNRFEENIGAKPFYEHGKSKVLNAGAKALNKINQITGDVMSGGDRIFYQSIFDNSLKNQMKLNGVTTPTQEMVDIATQEALSRTWNDSNSYTKAVLQIRSAMNKLNIKGYGLGDVLVPFAKTPANLTKAIVDYSPVGLARSILQDGKILKNSLENGQYNAQMQHKFADSFGKGVAGSILWVAAYALAKAGVTSGASDDDKDVANFMRNTMGIQPYSIKIGNKSFTYDWAQPIAAPLAAMADFQRLSEKEEKDLGSIIKTMTSSASNILLEQSFLSSIQDVFNSYNGPTEAIQQQIQDLPARATPTFFKQVADLIDPKQRQTYVKGNEAQTTKNKVQVKIPGASKKLVSQRDTLGREIEKYGGDDNKLQYAFNVFLNPANTNKGKPSEAAAEIYDVYKNTGDKTVMPRQVGYSEYIDGKSTPLTPEERNEWQKLAGEKVEESVKALVQNEKYQQMDYDDKAAVINGIVNYSFAKAKSEVFDIPISNTYKTPAKKEEQGIPLYDYYVDRVSKRK